jgi:hypothetical protein
MIAEFVVVMASLRALVIAMAMDQQKVMIAMAYA